MRYLQVIEQNVMQSPRAEKPKQMTRGGEKWKRLSGDIQEWSIQEKRDNKENEIRMGNKKGMEAEIEITEGCETFSKKVNVERYAPSLHNNQVE